MLGIGHPFPTFALTGVVSNDTAPALQPIDDPQAVRIVAVVAAGAATFASAAAA